MTRRVRVLELRSVWGTGGGPDKTILSGTRLTDPHRFDVTVCYIRDKRDQVFSIDRRAREMGLNYVEILEAHSFDHRVWPQLKRLVHDLQIDIVHAHDHKTDALAWAMGRRMNIIPLSTAHGFSGYSRSEQIYYAVEKRLLARFPRVIAVSQPIKRELVRTGSQPDRVVVINNGIDAEAFKRPLSERPAIRDQLGLPAGAIVIGAVGRLEQEKRFDVLLDAFGALRRDRPEAMLVIVGEGTLRSQIRSQAERLAIADAVRLPGQRSDLNALHSAFDVFVQSSEREGTPNAVLEAMALETPIVATDVGGTTELAAHEHHALIVPRNDPVELQRAVERCLRDPHEARLRAIRARRRVETDLSFRTRMRRVERVYEELMATHPKHC
jgi:glycosyltransferase involved in cell wall biosynthesis